MKEGKCLYWDYERIWVENESFRDENSGNVGEYTRYVLKDFNVDDGTPITLKAILFNMYNHWNGGSVHPAEVFKNGI